jgi:hypothetical protein
MTHGEARRKAASGKTARFEKTSAVGAHSVAVTFTADPTKEIRCRCN